MSRGFYNDILFYCYGENERTAGMRLYPNSVHLRGKNTGPDTQLTEPTLMYISWYPFKFSTVSSHCGSSSTTALILTWKGRRWDIVLHTFHIYLRTLLFTWMDAHTKKKLMKGQNVNSKFYFWTDNIQWKKRTLIPQIRPSSVLIPLPTTCIPQLCYSEECFQGILKLIPNLLLNY